MATISTRPEKKIKEVSFSWEGKDRSGKAVKGEMRAAGAIIVTSTLRRQGIRVTKVTKTKSSGTIKAKDITLFTRQLATMMKSGVPLLQAFDIVGKGHSNRAVSKLLMDIKLDVETGSSLANAFRKYPLYFDSLYCNLVAAGEAAGILDNLLDRLATYKEKIQAIKGKIKSALFYPLSIIVVAFIITAVIMIFVIPSFKELFEGFGADLPAPTLLVMAISDFFVDYWWAIFGGIGASLYTFFYIWKRSATMQRIMDRLALRLPIFGEVIRKATIARWSRTLSTMFAAGVPLVEALESVAGAAGNHVYYDATKKIQLEVSTGNSLVDAMTQTNVFPSMVLQMVAIGEESGSLDSMLSKIADFFEAEVDNAVEALSSLMEPLIMVVLGTLIGGMVIAMYLPIFKMGQVV
ncbi:MAG TPA: type II secretion system F family protein [Nitrosomonas nitrosa]|jgi:type IV pilus assembly protein PilC|uniref:Type 4 fimbrial assembly protein PilC n=1 Tax=Nitrosomonas nitrosa TaxID=52442 RepID=A0A1I4PIE8_9PROT|nr:type II secretion system F family protein [Nitrosomonas nitrosa]MCO6434049.1 type II secretion system F family protein [Nitrosomonas nitrosa]PTR00220.1 type IV pilus assembly protein PilC [Nitrosomonas nitrosa]CAE6508803.1 Type 4 fimbrial assembly protein PilC [Nitrosomonas nitrosa]SFM27611.1 type IV pilus assembly protein PilC [Nitrosomonas nitrosa]HBZ30259.1 type II secretion system F family protein [Nitrosomonas nitrosa]